MIGVLDNKYHTHTHPHAASFSSMFRSISLCYWLFKLASITGVYCELLNLIVHHHHQLYSFVLRKKSYLFVKHPAKSVSCSSSVFCVCMCVWVENITSTHRCAVHCCCCCYLNTDKTPCLYSLPNVFSFFPIFSHPFFGCACVPVFFIFTCGVPIQWCWSQTAQFCHS